jgi:hypothetical protein
VLEKAVFRRLSSMESAAEDSPPLAAESFNPQPANEHCMKGVGGIRCPGKKMPASVSPVPAPEEWKA